jgi:hypothetical protein
MNFCFNNCLGNNFYTGMIAFSELR